MLGTLLIPLALVSCGTDEDPRAPRAGELFPECDVVWVVGEQLPQDYDGCIDEGDDSRDTITASFTECRTGQRFGYATVDGKYARRGERIVDQTGLAKLAADCDAKPRGTGGN